jgi:hypothetical protein
LLLQASVRGVQVSAELAAYAADGFGVDTEKVWFTVRSAF